MLRIVNQSKRTDATGFKTQITHHPFGRSERQFPGCFLPLRHQHLLQPMLDVMNRQIVFARETNQVMLISLVVAHEDVLTMHTPVFVPPSFGLLYRLALRVVIRRERNSMPFQIPQHCLLPIRYDFVFLHSLHSF